MCVLLFLFVLLIFPLAFNAFSSSPDIPVFFFETQGQLNGIKIISFLLLLYKVPSGLFPLWTVCFIPVFGSEVGHVNPGEYGFPRLSTCLSGRSAWRSLFESYLEAGRTRT